MSNKDYKRIDCCSECGKIRTISYKTICLVCRQRFKRRNEPKFFLGRTYNFIMQRCTRGKRKKYLGLNFCSRIQFINKFLTNSIFLRLFKNWKDNNFDINFTPSIDRIDSKLGYTIDNIQFLTHFDNSMKDQTLSPIVQLTKDGDIVAYYKSHHEASEITGISRGNITSVCSGNRKTAGGYKFEYVKTT
jgi:hypothetical protein